MWRTTSNKPWNRGQTLASQKAEGNKGVEGLTMGVLLLLIHGRSSYIHPATTAHSWQETTSHLSQGNGG